MIVLPKLLLILWDSHTAAQPSPGFTANSATKKRAYTGGASGVQKQNEMQKFCRMSSEIQTSVVSKLKLHVAKAPRSSLRDAQYAVV